MGNPFEDCEYSEFELLLMKNDLQPYQLLENFYNIKITDENTLNILMQWADASLRSYNKSPVPPKSEPKSSEPMNDKFMKYIVGQKVEANNPLPTSALPEPKQEEPQPEEPASPQPVSEPASPKPEEPASPKQEEPASPKSEEPSSPPASPKSEELVSPKQEEPASPKPEEPAAEPAVEPASITPFTLSAHLQSQAVKDLFKDLGDKIANNQITDDKIKETIISSLGCDKSVNKNTNSKEPCGVEPSYMYTELVKAVSTEDQLNDTNINKLIYDLCRGGYDNWDSFYAIFVEMGTLEQGDRRNLIFNKLLELFGGYLMLGAHFGLSFGSQTPQIERFDNIGTLQFTFQDRNPNITWTLIKVRSNDRMFGYGSNDKELKYNKFTPQEIYKALEFRFPKSPNYNKYVMDSVAKKQLEIVDKAKAGTLSKRGGGTTKRNINRNNKQITKRSKMKTSNKNTKKNSKKNVTKKNATRRKLQA